MRKEMRAAITTGRRTRPLHIDHERHYKTQPPTNNCERDHKDTANETTNTNPNSNASRNKVVLGLGKKPS